MFNSTARYRLRWCLTLCAAGVMAVASSSASAQAVAAMSAARVMSVSGDVKVIDAQGTTRALVKGAEVRSGEKIITADGALAQIRLNDGGFMSIRPGTEMVIDRFNYDEKNAANSNLLISLLRGGMRSISGMIGKTNPDGYQIKSNTATVGIRGTDHEPMVIPPNVPALAALGQPGLYDKVNEGETFIRNQVGLLSIKKGEVGFAAVGQVNMAPQALKVIPEFYKIEVKVDARDPKEAAAIDALGRRTLTPTGGGLLRPTTAARREALSADGLSVPIKSLDAVRTLDVGVSTTTIAPTTTTVAPIASPTTLAPISATLSPTLTVVEPVVSPVLSTSTLPTLSTSTISTTTLVAPTTSTLSTSTISPTLSTTTISPIISSTLSSSTLIAPTTTTIVSPTTSTLSTTTISPTLSTTTLKTLK